jgi:outer membrane protein
MKKAVLSTVSIAVLSFLGTQAQAESLLDIYQLASKNDPLIQEAQANYYSAIKGKDIARSSLLPQLSASASYTNSDSSTEIAGVQGSTEQDSTRTSLGITLKQEIYHHDTWLNLSKNEKAIKQAELSFQASEQSLIIRTVQAYLDVLKAQDDNEFVNAEKQAIERQLEQTKQRFEVGLTAITDVHEAQAQYDNAIAKEITAENNVSLAIENLRAITGAYTPALDKLNTDLFSPSMPSPNSANDWIEISKQHSKDLQSKMIGKDIAKKDIDIASAGHYPKADMTAGYSIQNYDGDNPNGSGQLDSDTNQLSWGLSVSVPLYSGGRTSAKVEQAQHAYVAASQRLELSFRVTERNVRNSFNQVTASLSRINALQQTVVSAQSALNATEAGFEVGTRTIVDVLNSTRNLFDAKRNLANVRYSYIIALLQLKQSAGNLSQADVNMLNKVLSAS